MASSPLFSDQEVQTATPKPQQVPQTGNSLFSDSEVHAASGAPAVQRSPEDEASNTRQMLVSGLTGMPTPNMTPAEQQQFQQGKAAGATSVPVVAAGASLPAVLAPVAEYMGHLDNIVKIAKALGWSGFGIKEAADVYKAVKGLTK